MGERDGVRDGWDGGRHRRPRCARPGAAAVVDRPARPAGLRAAAGGDAEYRDRHMNEESLSGSQLQSRQKTKDKR